MDLVGPSFLSCPPIRLERIRTRSGHGERLITLALTGISLAVVRDVLQFLAASKPQSRKILSLGYPDMLVPFSLIQELFGADIARNVEYRPDSESILRWHGLANSIDKIVEAKHFFSLLGYDLAIADISPARGDEIILDLNMPCPEKMHQEYALVIDGGTLEHCFNIAQAMKNIASMVAQGGWIVQGNPINWYDHGFYNLNPAFYFEFYGKNGFSVEFFKIVTNPHNPQIFDLPSSGRLEGLPDRCTNLLAVVRKEIVDIAWPIQTKYIENPTLKGS